MIYKKYNIQTILNIIVIALTLPMTVIFIVFTYSENEKLIESYSRDFTVRATDGVIASVDALFNPVLSAARSAAVLAATDPGYFLSAASSDYLHELVAADEAVTSAYIAYADGSLRQVSKIIPGGLFFDYEAPAGATLANRTISPMITGEQRNDRVEFFSSWGKKISERVEPSSFDPRLQPFYRNALQKGAPTLTDPAFSPSARELNVNVAAPIRSNGQLVGVFSFNISLKTLSVFVRDNPVSVNSKTIIADADGGVIAHPELDRPPLNEAGKTRQVKLASLTDPALRGAMAARLQSGGDVVTFRAGLPAREYTAMFLRFPPSFEKNWEVITVTPSDDFLGDLHRNRTNIMLLAGVGVLFQLLLINLASRAFSRPIERLAKEVESIRAFDFAARPPIRTSVSEIAELRKAVGLLNDAVEAFSSYMPRGLVQQLMDSGEPNKLGGQSRYLTIFFTDLEGFTTLSETTPAQQLLERVSQYLEVVSRAVNEEAGTIDKFIGDAVMAFWGAPALRDDHAYRACVAAVRAQRRMAVLNARWVAEGLPPLRVRIGIHSDAVLVGNIGSAERMSYTVLGDGVNIAARLEGINKEFGTWICISQNVYREAGERLWLRPMDRATVKGRRAEIKIFELIGIRGADPELEATPEEQILCALTEAAFNAYVAGDIETALTLYRDCSERFPEDGLTRRMADRLASNLLEERLALGQ